MTKLLMTAPTDWCKMNLYEHYLKVRNPGFTSQIKLTSKRHGFPEIFSKNHLRRWNSQQTFNLGAC